jgi:hypothetical protein
LTLMLDDDIKDAYPDPEKIKKDSFYTLIDIYDSEEYKGKVEVSYKYDHSDSWDYTIVFLGRTDLSMWKQIYIPDKLLVVCLRGEGHPYAEDCRSSGGWEHLKSMFKKGKKDPEARKDWYKQSCANSDPKGLDPYKWDNLDINIRLAKIK